MNYLETNQSEDSQKNEDRIERESISNATADEINRQIRASKIGYSPLEAILDMMEDEF